MTDKLKNHCTIYIVRHGESDWNEKELIQGQKNTPRLTKKGERQVHIAKKRFKNIHFDAIFSSDLIRAKRTAEIIALERKLAVKTSQAIREQSMGKYEGVKGSVFMSELKDLIDKLRAMSDKDRFKYKRPHGIESHEEAITRFIRFLREISVAYQNKTVLMVSHGGLMRFFLHHLGFATYKELDYKSITNLAHIKLLSDGIDFFIKETYGIKKKKVK